MIDKESQIYTNVKSAISSLCTSSSTTFTDSPPTFPHLFLSQRDNPSTEEDLDNNENAVEPLFEITIFSKGTGAYTAGKNIMKLADTEMRSMGFRRTFGPQQVTNASDTTITRIIARYTRIIGSGDSL